MSKETLKEDIRKKRFRTAADALNDNPINLLLALEGVISWNKVQLISRIRRELLDTIEVIIEFIEEGVLVETVKVTRDGLTRLLRELQNQSENWCDKNVFDAVKLLLYKLTED
ncbi:MAG: hypothetical protein UR28_C0010G0048 [Candidatus Peregrinibacteria bacterium GW2011_GWF2_33_10]|nr:MAG: hypothetical protein UR28_C0010G0048 [Candidatus Peregrinibacteria bacterium GW2011_GWF2_33_10]OGJ46104.1 MAG: hypothetical protein A2272_05255 [Candidatus Peregrinibacteria bacterium RIFOXYA12_FULL_33_12]OGJ46191.1 MAG: hypothetical protein A2263_04870 [Candidatus Peregrinibacteria bacterium RIFOXYA2_FULL_33_21]OGJ51607.1 MAG: hypothetical protein A2307_04040 [Candidatus Peregrinibacteria bacterium RIFOXYB2_FULL_33_20]